ncbi:Nucleotidyltransferase [Coprinopsis marcescibilis]|uniref:DNA polymerase n=1 Tax=Coprinopsis marcescibilis TaxID=230819 RepID=A0A5C3KVL1_COPMA|nr:Nucleotidyltransferase [Coprinopsis marcescibilis]
MLARHILHSPRSTRILSFCRKNVQFYSTQLFRTPNEAVLNMLRKEKEQEALLANPNSFKINAFVNAINVISQLETTIRSGDDEILALKGIGPGIKNRIHQHFIRHDMARAQTSKETEDAMRRKAVLDLQRVPGIGSVKAKSLVEAGCMGLESLIGSEKFHEQLTPQQIIGLKYIDHLEVPASRELVEKVLELLRDNVSSKYEIIPVGEFRRRFPKCSSIELLLIHSEHAHIPIPTAPSPFAEDPLGTLRSTKRAIKKSDRRPGLTRKDRENSSLHSDVIPLLQKRGLFTDKISEAHNSWTGVVRLPPQSQVRNLLVESRAEALPLRIEPGDYRRITIHSVPQKSKAAALLHLTGDDEHTRQLERRADAMGMLFDEFGLWKWNHQEPEPCTIENAIADPSTLSKRGFWSLLKADDEQDIFDTLGLPYVDPTRRNFGFLRPTRPKQKKYSSAFV